MEQALWLMAIPMVLTLLVWQIDWLPLRVGLGIPAVVLVAAASKYGYDFVRSEWWHPVDNPSPRSASRDDKATQDEKRTPDVMPDYSEPQEEAAPTVSMATFVNHSRGDGGSSNLRDVLAASGAIAAIAYALSRISLSQFYGRFQVTPEEVGWDLQATVAGFGVVILVIGFGVTLAVTAMAVALNTLGHTFNKHRKRSWTTHWQNGVALGLVASAVLLATGFLTYPRSLAEEVAAGSVPTSALLRTLPVQASCVRFLHPEVMDMNEDGPLVLLGSRNGVAVLFDTDLQQSIRIGTTGLQLVSSDECPAAPTPWWLF